MAAKKKPAKKKKKVVGTPFTSETGRAAGKKSRRGPSLRNALIKLFEGEIKNKGKLTPEAFVKACTLHGMKGNAGMAKIIFEYLDGKVPSTIKLGGDNEADSIKIEFVN